MRERFIIHLNVADFAVAVERMLDSRLQSRPVIIALQKVARAVVYDMSEEAFCCGVRKEMLLTRARRLCPDAEILAPRPARYEQAMRRLFEHARPYSPLIEITDHKGHLFIDVTGTQRLFGPPPDVAWRIRKALRTDMGINPIWSVAPNKLVAKVATRAVKPSGEYIVRAGEEADFLGPLPIHLIPGIESWDLRRLKEFNLILAGHVAALAPAQLDTIFGRRSQSLLDAARGLDSSPVLPAGQAPPKVCVDHCFESDTNDRKLIQSILYRLVETAGADLRQRRLAARRIGIILDYCDGLRSTRQAVLRPATAGDFGLFRSAAAALESAWQRRVRIRHLKVVCDRLTFPPAQQELFPEAESKKQSADNLMTAIDAVRQRFGTDAVRMGRTLNIKNSSPSGSCVQAQLKTGTWRRL